MFLSKQRLECNGRLLFRPLDEWPYRVVPLPIRLIICKLSFNGRHFRDRLSSLGVRGFRESNGFD